MLTGGIALREALTCVLEQQPASSAKTVASPLQSGVLNIDPKWTTAWTKVRAVAALGSQDRALTGESRAAGKGGGGEPDQRRQVEPRHGCVIFLFAAWPGERSPGIYRSRAHRRFVTSDVMR